MSAFVLHHGDVLDVLRGMPDASFDAVFSDVPYGLGSREPTVDELVAYLTGAELDLGGDFMSADWKIPSVAVWRELLRVLKPGAPVLAFAGSKTQDLIAIGMRAAGFEIRDCVMWMYAQGWAKGLRIDKAIDALNGDEREIVGPNPNARPNVDGHGRGYSGPTSHDPYLRAPGSEASARWAGHNTTLAPSYEPCLLAMKPLEGNFAENAIKHGVAGINVDGARIATDWSERSEAWKRSGHSAKPGAEKIAAPPGIGITCHPGGRWPKNVVLDEGAAALLDEQSGILHTHAGHITREAASNVYGRVGRGPARQVLSSSGGASRMFYVAKASRAERSFGCEHLPKVCGRCEGTEDEEWEREVLSPNERTDTTSTPRAISDEAVPLSEPNPPRNTSTYGKRLMVPSLPGTKSTTGTKTSKTTDSTTSSASRRQSTSESIPGANCETASGSSRAVAVDTSSPSTSGTGTSREGAIPSTTGAGPATSDPSSSPSVCARCGSELRTPSGPCIKPLKLVRYLATLIQPPKRAHAPRRLLVPYAGTGSEMIGALRAGWEEVVGIEREGPEGEDYLAIAQARLERWSTVPEDLDEARAVSAAETTPAGQIGLFGGSR